MVLERGADAGAEVAHLGGRVWFEQCGVEAEFGEQTSLVKRPVRKTPAMAAEQTDLLAHQVFDPGGRDMGGPPRAAETADGAFVATGVCEERTGGDTDAGSEPAGAKAEVDVDVVERERRIEAAETVP